MKLAMVNPVLNQSVLNGPITPSTIRRAVDRRGLTSFAAGTLACALVASAALFHAWVRTRVTEEGYRLSRLSAEYRELVRDHERLQFHAAQLKSPQRIEELARTRLEMGPPTVDRVVVLVGGALRVGTSMVSSR